MNYSSVEIIEDSWLVLLGAEGGPLIPPALSFVDTKDGGELAITTFSLDCTEQWFPVFPTLVSDQGVYGPSHPPAPFCSNTSQRVFVVRFPGEDRFLVVKTEALLRLAQERKGEDIHWREWQAHATWVLRESETVPVSLSGPRLFCVYLDASEETMMDVYDFSPRAPAMCTEMIEDGTAREVVPSVTQTLPWGIERIVDSYGCHDSMTFVLVKNLHSSNLT